MGFRLPTFNIMANLWKNPNDPSFGPPDVAVGCQLRAPGKQSVSLTTDPLAPTSLLVEWELLLPAGTDIADAFSSAFGVGDVVEVPAGSTRYYWVEIVDDVARGFPNEYRIAYIRKTFDFGLWPRPIP
jgi:hypothetical protein